MPGLTCNACNKVFLDENERKIHYKSEWHSYNLKRKVAGVPGLTETLFEARLSAIAEETKTLSETPLLYSCGHCGKEYRSIKAHAQHLKSTTHLARIGHHDEVENSVIIIKPLPHNKRSDENEDISDSDESEWEEEEMVDEATDSLDPCCCFMCDLKHDTVETCIVHMHKKHGFFVPDIEYLNDPKGFLTYLGVKVKRNYMCLYCNDSCRPFSSLEAVRKHMEAKNHCKVHYGDGGDDEEAELEEFYDYSSSYVDATGYQSSDFKDSVELGNGGSELVITRKTDDGVSVKSLGSREFMRYYRQKPRPTRTNDVAALASRHLLII